jgi:hypothetical protein
VPTTAMPPPAGQRYPQMRRHLPDGHRPPRRRRDRRCQPRDIPATEVARRNYHRILSMAGPADKAAAAVLTVLLDARPALVEADTPDTRPDQACEEAAGVAAGLHRQGFPLADVLQVLARRWAPGTEPYRAGEQVARLNDQRVRNQRVRSGARAGP